MRVPREPGEAGAPARGDTVSAGGPSRPGGGSKPQARFLWHRLTPGNLGLEFTSAMAVLAVALFIVIGYGVIVGDDPGPTHGDETAFDDRGRPAKRRVHRRQQGRFEARLGAGHAGRRRTGGAVARDSAELAGAGGAGGGSGTRPHRGADPEGGARAAAAARPAGRRRRLRLAQRPCRVRGHLSVAGIDRGAAAAPARSERHGVDRARGAAGGRGRAVAGVPAPPFLSDVTSGAALGVVAVRGMRAVVLVVAHFRDNGAPP